MEWVETTARSVEEAKSLALDQLGVDTEDAEFEIVEEPRAGLFGRVRGEARVRARVRPTRPRPKVERRDRRRKGSSNAGTGDTDEEQTATDGRDSRDDASSQTTVKASAAEKTTKKTTKKTATAQINSDQPVDTATSGSTASSTPSQQRTPRGKGTPMSNPDESVDTEQENAVDPATVGAEATKFLEGMLLAFDLEGAVSCTQEGAEIDVRVDGADLGLMVGPRGATLAAVQELTRVVSQRRLGDHETRLRVDVAGYRERRREALSRFATTMADEVAASGVARVLEPMASADRKVIHDVLSGRADVETRSEGDDPKRRVVIDPVG